MEAYRCMNEQCHVIWEDKIGPLTCKACGSRYVEWTSYNQPVKTEVFNNGLTFEFKERK